MNKCLIQQLLHVAHAAQSRCRCPVAVWSRAVRYSMHFESVSYAACFEEVQIMLC
jgi:hypothetical protein